MKTLNVLLTSCLLLGLTACGSGKTTVVEKHYVENGGTGLPQTPTTTSTTGQTAGTSGLGGIDGAGGGNGFKGKPLDQFRVDLKTVPAYKRLYAKVISKLIVRFPKLAGDLTYIADARSWNFIKTELKTLPAAKIGVSFKTDQMALQTKSEIWINDLIFPTMADEDQEALILHELLMGIRLLEFQNSLDICLANISSLSLTSETQQAYEDARRKCYHDNRLAADVGDNLGFDKTINLKASDYDEIIRPMTNLLMNEVDTFNVQELEDEMAIRKFRIYKDN